MRLTRFGAQGLAFTLVMVLGFFAAPYSNLFFLLLAFLTSLGLVGIVAARRNLHGVALDLADVPPVPAGTPIELEATVTAPGRFGIEAHLELASGERLSGRVAFVEGRGRLVLRAAGLPRGLHAVRRAFVETRHPFEVVRVTRDVAAPRELVVHPAPAARAPGRTAVEALDALLGAPHAGDLQPSGLRDHREGEGVRGVHWRASARRDRLVVQEWEGGLGQGLEVVLDRRCPADELEQALSIVAALIGIAREGKETLRLHSQGLSTTFGDGQRPWAEALRFLAGAGVLPADAGAPPPTSPGVPRLPTAPAVEVPA
jgi:uncharacterized protein (DUF58 family)